MEKVETVEAHGRGQEGRSHGQGQAQGQGHSRRLEAAKVAARGQSKERTRELIFGLYPKYEKKYSVYGHRPTLFEKDVMQVVKQSALREFQHLYTERYRGNGVLTQALYTNLRVAGKIRGKYSPKGGAFVEEMPITFGHLTCNKGAVEKIINETDTRGSKIAVMQDGFNKHGDCKHTDYESTLDKYESMLTERFPRAVKSYRVD